MLNRFRPPRPPQALRHRVLSAAADALTTGNPPGIWERLWTSRPLRAAWAVTTFGLLCAHAALSMTGETGRPGRLAGVRDDAAELRELLALPHVEISPRAERRSMVEPDKPNDNNEVKS